MSKYKFGKRSMGNLNTCHPDLILIAIRALRNSQIDFGISEGHRSLKRQKELYDAGKSKIDGISKKGKHNYDPSRAFDFYVYVAGKKHLAYDIKHLMYLVGVLTATAEELYHEEEISHILRSGANWDGDSELIYDQSFFDAPHVELIKPNRL